MISCASRCVSSYYTDHQWLHSSGKSSMRFYYLFRDYYKRLSVSFGRMLDKFYFA